MTRKLSALIESVTQLYDGFLRFSEYRLKVDKHSGGQHELRWLLLESGDAVSVLGYDPHRDEIVLINELRPGMLVAGEYPFSDNLVAGRLNAGEAVLSAAAREMNEETGLELRDPMIVHSGAFVSSGTSTERIAIVFGFVSTETAGGVHGNPNENEDIATVVLPARQFIQRVRNGEITDLKTLVAGYWFAERHSQLQGQLRGSADPSN